MHTSAPHRGRIRSAVVASGIAVCFTLVGAAPAFAAPATESVSLTATPSVSVGDTVDIGLKLVGATDIFAYDVTLTFDPAVLSYVDGSATGPTGGFDSVEKSTGSITLVNSRLGTSPALSGDLASIATFTAVGSGDASIAASTVSLVDETGATTALSDAATADVVVAAAPTPTPTPSETSTPSPTTGTGDATSTPTAVAAASSSNGTGSLALTGLSIGGSLLLGVAVIVIGIFAVRRRKSVTR
ncbi:MAG: hypothetical protein JWQ64_1148 [Subtercola sp.]|nr:hypothetical protein [Subtercola sp.]